MWIIHENSLHLRCCLICCFSFDEPSTHKIRRWWWILSCNSRKCIKKQFIKYGISLRSLQPPQNVCAMTSMNDEWEVEKEKKKFFETYIYSFEYYLVTWKNNILRLPHQVENHYELYSLLQGHCKMHSWRIVCVNFSKIIVFNSKVSFLLFLFTKRVK